MSKTFKIFNWILEIDVGNTYWGDEPEPLKAAWNFNIRLDYNNKHKLKKNHDFTKILIPEIHGGKWVAFNELNTAIVDYDTNLQTLSKRIKEKGIEVTYMKYALTHA